MARFSVFAVASGVVALLVPAALALPFEHPRGRLPGHHRPVWTHTTNDHPYTLTHATTTTSTQTTRVCTTPTGVPPAPLPSGTGIPPTGIFPTGTAASGTGLLFSSTPPLQEREAQALALQKRKAFEGPRHSHFPHFWPPSAPAPAAHRHGDATPSGSMITITITGGSTATGNGSWAVSTGWVGSSLTTAGTGTGVLTLPIESGIVGLVPKGLRSSM